MDNSEEKCARVRPLLKAGQVWIDRCGDAVTISDCPALSFDRHRYPYLGFVARDVPLREYNENGWRVNEDDSGPSYLVRLYVGSDRDEVDENPERELCWRCEGKGIVGIGERKWANCPDCNAHNDESKESPALDPNKPIQLKKDHSIQGRITYGPTKRGVLLIELPGDDIVGNVDDWENIPEPKRTATRELTATMEDGRLMIRVSGQLHYLGEISYAEVTYTEGEGWSIEEIKS